MGDLLGLYADLEGLETDLVLAYGDLAEIILVEPDRDESIDDLTELVLVDEGEIVLIDFICNGDF